MCGIAGFLHFDGRLDRDTAVARVTRMVDVIRHRGPDDRGVWTDGTCGLGHARLSIIDLSPAGHQPMATHDGRYWIVFNGEIYNFQEIRTELEARGAQFRSHSDTEVILEGYRVWGDAVIDRLRGMFAFALWDSTLQRLLLARDRLGKKPLYWCRLGNALIFGSELKALVAWPGLSRRSTTIRSSISDLSIHSGAAHDFPGGQQTASGAQDRCATRSRRLARQPCRALLASADSYQSAGGFIQCT